MHGGMDNVVSDESSGPLWISMLRTRFVWGSSGRFLAPVWFQDIWTFAGARMGHPMSSGTVR